MKKTSKQIRSSGNVFSDLGFRPREAESLRIRAQLMAEIERYIQNEGISQSTAAKRLGVSQPRISDLVRGKIHLFSVDALIEMVAHAGLHVDLRIKRKPAA